MSNTAPLEPAYASRLREGSLATRKVLIVVENLPVPFDRRVWQEATRAARCRGRGFDNLSDREGVYLSVWKRRSEGIHIYRHRLPLAGEAIPRRNSLSSTARRCSTKPRLAWKILFRHGFDTIGCLQSS